MGFEEGANEGKWGRAVEGREKRVNDFGNEPEHDLPNKPSSLGAHKELLRPRQLPWGACPSARWASDGAADGRAPPPPSVPIVWGREVGGIITFIEPVPSENLCCPRDCI